MPELFALLKQAGYVPGGSTPTPPPVDVFGSVVPGTDLTLGTAMGRLVATDIRRFMTSPTESLEFAMARARTAGVKHLIVPSGDWYTNGSLFVGDGMWLQGEGPTSRIISRGPEAVDQSIIFLYGGDGTRVSDMTLALRNFWNAGITLRGAANDTVVERVVITQLTTLFINAVQVVVGGNVPADKGVDGIRFKEVIIDKPGRMGIEILNQGPLNEARPYCRNVEVIDCVVRHRPEFATGFLPSVSLDGLMEGAIVRGLKSFDCRGTDVELIEANNAAVDGCTFVRPKGPIVVASNTRGVQRPRIMRNQIVEPGAVSSISIASAQNAIIRDNILPKCVLINSIAPNTEVINNVMSNPNGVVVFNEGGSGGGKGMIIQGGVYEGFLQFAGGGTTAGSSVNGVRISKFSGLANPDGKAITGGGAAGVAAANNTVVADDGTVTIGAGN